MDRRRFVLIIMLGLAMLLVSACAAQPAAPEATQEVAVGVVNALDQFMPPLRLPRVEVAYGADGVPSIFGIRTTSIESLVPISLAFLNLQPEYVNWLTSRNLQHLEVEVHQDGVFLYANGKALPYLAWDADSLDAAGQLLDSTDAVQFDTVIRRALPLVRRLGIDLVLRFPKADAAADVPLRARDARMPAVGEGAEPSTVVQLAMQYTNDGLPSLMGLTSRDLRPLGIDLAFMELPEPTVTMLKTAGLQSLRLVTRPDGIIVSVNDQALPHLAYSDAHLNNAIDLTAQLYGENPTIGLLRNVVPLVRATNLDLTVGLPGR